MFDSEEGFEAWWEDAVAASARGELTTWSEQEIEQHPLFCSDVPADITANPGLVAMQNLIYDEPPETVAATFKANGNEALIQGNFEDAAIFYSKGLQMAPVPAALRATLFSNRAQTYLKLRKYPEAFSDARKALYLDPSSTKAAYRGAVACHKLNLWKDGLLFVAKALEVCAEAEQTLFSEYKSIFSAEVDKKENQKISGNDSILVSLLSTRDISLAKQVYTYPGTSTAAVHLNEDKQSLLFPVLVLYDEFSQSDWMLSVHESLCVLDVYDTLFETVPEWLPPSRVSTYSAPANLTFFLEFHNPDNPRSQNLVQIDPALSLDQLTRGKTLVGFPVFHAIAKDRKTDIDSLLEQHTLIHS